DGIRDFHVTGVQTCALPIYALPPQSSVQTHPRGRAPTRRRRRGALRRFLRNVHRVPARYGRSPRRGAAAEMVGYRLASANGALRSEERRVGRGGRGRGGGGA